MRALMLVSFLIVLSRGLWAQEDSSEDSLQRTFLWYDTRSNQRSEELQAASETSLWQKTVSWRDTFSIVAENYRNRVWPRFPTPLTLESWLEYKADTLARTYVQWVGQSVVFNSIRAGFHQTTYYIRPDTTWATRPPTFEGWMNWLEQRKY